MYRKPHITEPRGSYAMAACAPAQTPPLLALFIGSILAVMLLGLPVFA